MSEAEVITRIENGVGRITLNRPRALNALTQDMVRAIDAALTDWAADPAVRGVLIRGAGEKGLCAGGDVVSLRSSLLAGRFAEAEEFFRDEYAMNERIATYPKPYVAFMDGVVLGGGMGVSAHGSHRVATERTRAGMPETAIGFTPDVGGSFHLARAPFQAGRHLAATSAHASGSDAVALGLADVFVESARLDELEQALAAAFGALGEGLLEQAPDHRRQAHRAGAPLVHPIARGLEAPPKVFRQPDGPHRHRRRSRGEESGIGTVHDQRPRWLAELFWNRLPIRT